MRTYRQGWLELYPTCAAQASDPPGFGGPWRSNWATRGLVALRGPERSDHVLWRGCFVEGTLEKRRRGFWICEMSWA
jgi:hypothetical protein